MDLKLFSKINHKRCTSPDGFNHSLDAWSYAEWTNAIAGELGEASNLTKKLLRHRDGIPGNIKTVDQNAGNLKRRAAEEIGDTIVYGDLAIQALGYDTSEILRRVFNHKSVELGCKILLPPPFPAIGMNLDEIEKICFQCGNSICIC